MPPKKGAKAKPAAAEEIEASAADCETPAKAAKRPQGKAAAKAEAVAADGEQDAKKLRRTLTPKRDKNEPLPRSVTPRQPVPVQGKALKVLSLNVAGLRSVLNTSSGSKAQILKQLVERERPDIFCLNEHKLKPEDVEENEGKLRELLPVEYTTFHWNCSVAKKGYSGVAVILRKAADGETSAMPDPEAVTVTKGLGKFGVGDTIAEEEGRVLTVDLPEVCIVAVYVPNSGSDLGRLPYRTDWNAKQCWDRQFGAYLHNLREEKNKPVVVIGDLNCCWKVQDIWNMYERPDFPEGLAEKPVADQYLGLTQLKKTAGLTPEERESFPNMLAKAGLVDTFRELHPSASGVFSYFSLRFAQLRPLNKGLRLDYVLASPSLCQHLKAAQLGDLPVPRLVDSFVLDEDELVADHSAVGCLLAF